MCAATAVAPFAIRPLWWRDLPSLAALTGPRSTASLARRAWLGRDKIGMWLAEQEGKTVGCLAVQIVARGQHGRRKQRVLRPARPARSCVTPDSIVQPLRFGLVRQLVLPGTSGDEELVAGMLHAAEQWLRCRGTGELHTFAPADPDHSRHGLYRREGFVPLQSQLARSIGSSGRLGAESLRRATHADTPALAELVRTEVELQQALSGWFELVSPLDWRAYVAGRLQCRDVAMLVAEHDGRLAGYVEVSVQRRFGVVEDVFVLPALRGRGIAARLVEQGCAWLRGRDVTVVRAAVWAGNTTSFAFFVHKLGFQPTGVTLRRKV